MIKLSFIGLGVMGFPMAGHLQQAAHDRSIYNRMIKKLKISSGTVRRPEKE